MSGWFGWLIAAQILPVLALIAVVGLAVFTGRSKELGNILWTVNWVVWFNLAVLMTLGLVTFWIAFVFFNFPYGLESSVLAR
jgi:hypothetical protein